jgi:hypothetical protein
MPKAKADQVITHRIEFQETEREALEMVAASITARNVTASLSNLATPFTTATVAGVAWTISILAVAGIALSETAQNELKEAGKGAVWQAALGPIWGTINALSNDQISNKFESIMSGINDKYI